MAKQRGLDPNAFADKVQEKAEKYASGSRIFSVLISGTFLAALDFRMRKYYAEHLVFSLYYYSFDFFFKSVFALLFLLTSAIGVKLPSLVLNFFYPIVSVFNFRVTPRISAEVGHDGVKGGGALRVRDAAVHGSEHRRVRDCLSRLCRSFTSLHSPLDRVN